MAWVATRVQINPVFDQSFLRSPKAVSNCIGQLSISIPGLSEPVDHARIINSKVIGIPS
jgi:hypothetical protein